MKHGEGVLNMQGFGEIDVDGKERRINVGVVREKEGTVGNFVERLW
jgi:hypothetical protein